MLIFRKAHSKGAVWKMRKSCEVTVLFHSTFQKVMIAFLYILDNYVAMYECSHACTFFNGCFFIEFNFSFW